MKKFLIALLTVAAALCFAFGFSACDNGPVEENKNPNGLHTVHVYDREIVAAEYLKSAATCTDKAVYYKSCDCGEKGTATFEYGQANGHSFNKEVSTSVYLKSEATCTEKAVY
ncbi:MAG: hypothetical protein K2K80_07600, partial [Clostridia bacterium]|nr:hypothetical protein [Clostridia bacterium]